MNYKAFLFVLAICFALGSSALKQDHEHGDTLGRLLMSHEADSTLTIFDLDTENVVNTLEASTSKANVYATEDGLFGMVVTSSTGTVRAINSGITYEDHGDHIDISKAEAKFTTWSAQGAKPAHVESHYGWVVVHFDGDLAANKSSQVIAVIEDELDEETATTLAFPPQTPNHGVAIAASNCHFVISEPDPNYAAGNKSSSLPDGFFIWNSQLVELTDLDEQGLVNKSCGGYHGTAASGNYHMFGCNFATSDDSSDVGVLLIEWHESTSTFSSRKILYPDNQRRTSTLVAHHDSPYFVGQYGRNPSPGYNNLVRIDPKKDRIAESDLLELPDGQVQCGFDFEKEHGQLIVTMLPDGYLYVYNVSDWNLVGSVQVVPLNESEQACGTGAINRNTFTVGAGIVYVAVGNGTHSVVKAVHLDSMAVEDEWTFNDVVWNLAIIGVPNPHDDADPASDCPLPSPAAPIAAPVSTVTPTTVSAPTSQVSLAVVNAPLAILLLFSYLISLQ
jgi:hypothetical protein